MESKHAVLFLNVNILHFILLLVLESAASIENVTTSSHFGNLQPEKHTANRSITKIDKNKNHALEQSLNEKETATHPQSSDFTLEGHLQSLSKDDSHASTNAFEMRGRSTDPPFAQVADINQSLDQTDTLPLQKSSIDNGNANIMQAIHSEGLAEDASYYPFITNPETRDDQSDIEAFNMFQNDNNYEMEKLKSVQTDSHAVNNDLFESVTNNADILGSSSGSTSVMTSDKTGEQKSLLDNSLDKMLQDYPEVTRQASYEDDVSKSEVVTDASDDSTSMQMWANAGQLEYSGVSSSGKTINKLPVTEEIGLLSVSNADNTSSGPDSINVTYTHASVNEEQPSPETRASSKDDPTQVTKDYFSSTHSLLIHANYADLGFKSDDNLTAHTPTSSSIELPPILKIIKGHLTDDPGLVTESNMVSVNQQLAFKSDVLLELNEAEEMKDPLPDSTVILTDSPATDGSFGEIALLQDGFEEKTTATIDFQVKKEPDNAINTSGASGLGLIQRKDATIHLSNSENLISASGDIVVTSKAVLESSLIQSGAQSSLIFPSTHSNSNENTELPIEIVDYEPVENSIKKSEQLPADGKWIPTDFWNENSAEDGMVNDQPVRYGRGAWEEDEPGASLAFIFDSTGSMQDELNQVKAGAAKILEALLANKEIVIHNFVLVPFKDPEIGPVSVTTNPKKFQEMIADISVSGGADCPEMSMGAIQRALQIARPGSYFYVFTDADAKDEHLLESVLSLIQQQQAQVVFILTGTCDRTEDYTSTGVYEKVAEASSGQVYHLKKPEVQEVLKYVKVALRPNKVNLISVKLPAPAINSRDNHTIVVDAALSEFTVSVSGKDADISVRNPDGVVQTGTDVEPLLNLTNVKIVNVKEPEPGPWQVAVGSNSDYSLRATGLSDVHFRHGFSSVPNVDIDETNVRPLQGTSCFLIISVGDPSRVYNVSSADIIGLNGSSVQTLTLSPHPTQPGHYISLAFTPPAPTHFFHLGITGYSSDGSPIRRVTNTAISSSLPEKPRIAMRPRVVARVNTAATLSCNVTSLVPFTVQWFKSDLPLTASISHPQTHQVTFVIEKLSEKSEGNFTCIATNLAGTVKASTYLAVTGSPPVVKAPSKKLVVIVGNSVELPCSVHSDFAVTISWDQLLSTDTSGRIRPVEKGVVEKNNSLRIGNVSEADTGWYMCVAVNRWGRRDWRVFLDVRDPLRVAASPARASFTTGQSLKLVCRAAGKPSPTTLQWRRDLIAITNKNASVYLEEVPGELTLLLNYLEKRHAGVYSCIARNQDEEASASTELFYTEQPMIKADSHSVVVREGASAMLQCHATGVPTPLISWRRGPQTLHSDHLYKINNGTLRISTVAPFDAGELTCVARNNVGVAEDHIWLSVGTPPSFLQKPRDKKIQLGHNGTVICSVVGSPQPAVSWTRVNGSLEATRMTPLTGGGLRISHARLADGGTYLCIGSNAFGNISAFVNITITGIKKPAVDKSVELKTVSAVSGGGMILPCGVVLGKPPGRITWLRGEVPVSPDNSTVLPDGQLQLHHVSSADSGAYTCIVTHPLGNTSRTFHLNVLVEPHVPEDTDGLAEEREVVKVGERTVLSCPVTGNPRPSIAWFLAGAPVNISASTYQDKEGNLVLEKANESDSGSYSCRGSNELGSTSFSVYLQVQVPPKVVDLLPESDAKQEVVEGYTAVLNCRMYGVPTPHVSWFKDDKPLTAHAADASTNVLRFIATLDDHGTYKCVVSNNIGTASKEFQLNILVPPRIIDDGDEPVEARWGQEATLQCGVTGVPAPVILWRRDGIYLTENTTDVTLIGSRLILHNVTEEATGAYTCDAENSAGIAQQTFYLHVTFAPRIIDDGELSGNRTITVVEGSELSLTCSAEGSPMPEISWLRNAEPLHQYSVGVLVMRDNTLFFGHITADHTGIYTCRANNSEGVTERHYSIEVSSPPGLLPDSDVYSLIEVNEGENLTLTCPTAGIAYTVHWLKNGRALSGSLRERGDEPPMRLAGGGRQLVLAEAHPADSGNYSCVASNRAGRVDASFVVFVLMTPHFEEFNHVARRILLVGGSVSLNCTVSGNPPPQVSWRKDVIPIVPGRPLGVVLSRDQHHLVIPSARTYHTGTYTCIATNKVMAKEREFYITVLEPPSIGGDVLTDMEIILGERLVLECPVTGEPRPNITWFADNCNGTRRQLNETTNQLVVEAVGQEDSTNFYCEAVSAAGKDQKTFNVTVLAPATIEGGETLEDVVVAEGQDVSLKCKVQGLPRPHVTWLHNGLEMEQTQRQKRDITAKTTGKVARNTSYEQQLRLSNEEVLVLHRIGRGARGLYTAIASNRAGFSEKSFRVQVSVAPKLAKSGVTNMEVMSGRPVEFSCPVEGSAPLNISWSRNAAPANETGEIILTGGKLRILNTTSAHAGNYTCTVTNIAGSASANVTLHILEPPWFSDGNTSNITLVRGALMELNCTARGNPDPTFTWLQGLQKLQQSSSTLKILYSETEGQMEFTCIASNTAGAAEKTFVVDVLEPPTALRVNESMSFLLHRRLELNCLMNGSRLEITWYKDKEEVLLENDIGLEMLNDKRQLVALHANGSHSGQYHCQARNLAGTSSIHFNVSIYVQAVWSDWSPWTACSASCGSGVKTRIRSCNAGEEKIADDAIFVNKTQCTGSGIEKEDCQRTCPIDGGWSEWSDWSTCSATCGHGTQQRRRSCTNPPPSNGGKPCNGDSVQHGVCPLDDCNGIWSAWSEWSDCSKSCGMGERQRDRYCIGAGYCIGPENELELCNVQPCKLNRAGSGNSKRWPWDPWSACSVTCGKGFRRRTKRCRAPFIRGKPCVDNVQVEECTQPCTANLQITGQLNGEPINAFMSAKMSDSGLKAKLAPSASLPWLAESDDPWASPMQRDDPKTFARWFPYAPLLLAPVAWSTAEERESAANGASLTRGRFLTQSDVTFSRGEGMTFRAEGHGVGSDGQLTVVIEVAGEVPLLEPSASLNIKSLHQDFVQVADDTLLGVSDDVMMMNDEPVHFHMNSSIKYDPNFGTMPFLVEKLSMTGIRPDESETDGEYSLRASTSVSKGFGSNVCPPGSQHDPQHMLCQDIDECLHMPCSAAQTCVNTWGSYVCECREGFSWSDGACRDVNECDFVPRRCQHSCVNTDGSFNCLCSMGYTLQPDGTSCTGSLNDISNEEISSYELDTNFRSEREQIIEDVKTNSWTPRKWFFNDAPAVSCHPGYFFDQKSCIDIDECKMKPGICDDGLCMNKEGSYQCIDISCPKGYQRQSQTTCMAECDMTVCRQGALVAESVVYSLVSLSESDFRPMEDLLQLTVQDNAAVKRHHARLLEGHALRLRGDGASATLYAPASLQPHTLYRMVAVMDSLGQRGELLYSTEFVVYVVYHRDSH